MSYDTARAYGIGLPKPGSSRQCAGRKVFALKTADSSLRHPSSGENVESWSVYFAGTLDEVMEQACGTAAIVDSGCLKGGRLFHSTSGFLRFVRRSFESQSEQGCPIGWSARVRLSVCTQQMLQELREMGHQVPEQPSQDHRDSVLLSHEHAHKAFEWLASTGKPAWCFFNAWQQI